MVPVQKKLNVLLIEDNPDDRFFIAQELRKLEPNIQLLEFQTADASLEHLRNNLQTDQPVLPDAILLDMNLPDMRGTEFLEQLRNLKGAMHIHVIVFTGQAKADDIEIAFRYHVAGFIIKPVDPASVRKALSAIVDFWQLCEFI